MNSPPLSTTTAPPPTSSSTKIPQKQQQQQQRKGQDLDPLAVSAGDYSKTTAHPKLSVDTLSKTDIKAGGSPSPFLSSLAPSSLAAPSPLPSPGSFYSPLSPAELQSASLALRQTTSNTSTYQSPSSVLKTILQGNSNQVMQNQALKDLMALLPSKTPSPTPIIEQSSSAAYLSVGNPVSTGKEEGTAMLIVGKELITDITSLQSPLDAWSQQVAELFDRSLPLKSDQEIGTADEESFLDFEDYTEESPDEESAGIGLLGLNVPNWLRPPSSSMLSVIPTCPSPSLALSTVKSAPILSVFPDRNGGNRLRSVASDERLAPRHVERKSSHHGPTSSIDLVRSSSPTIKVHNSSSRQNAVNTAIIANTANSNIFNATIEEDKILQIPIIKPRGSSTIAITSDQCTDADKATTNVIKPPLSLRSSSSNRQLVRLGVLSLILDPNQVMELYLFLFSDVLVMAKPAATMEATTVKSRFSPLMILPLTGAVVSTLDVFTADDPKMPTALLQKVVKTFNEVEAEQAVRIMIQERLVRDDPLKLASFFHSTRGLDRRVMGRYLTANPEVRLAFIDRIPTRGLSLVDATWVLLKMVRLPRKEAARDAWLQAIAQIWARNNSNQPLSMESALIVLRAASQKYLMPSDPELRKMAEDLRKKMKARFTEEDNEDIALANHEFHAHIAMLTRFPLRITLRTISQPAKVVIPRPDPHFRVYLVGENGLKFEPEVLEFSRSNEARFTVTGLKVGKKRMAFLRAGKRAGAYSQLGCRTILVERPFMEWTFRLDFCGGSDWEDALQKFARVNEKGQGWMMFSVESRERRQAWFQSLDLRIKAMNSSSTSSSFLISNLYQLLNSPSITGTDLIRQALDAPSTLKKEERKYTV